MNHTPAHGLEVEIATLSCIPCDILHSIGQGFAILTEVHIQSMFIMAEVTGSTEITSEDREFAKEILNHVYKGTLTVSYANDQLVVIAAKIVYESGECSSSMNIVNIVFSLFASNVQGKINMLKVLREGGKALRRNGKFYSSCIKMVTSKYRSEVEMNL